MSAPGVEAPDRRGQAADDQAAGPGQELDTEPGLRSAVRQLRRERAMLIAALVLIAALAMLDRVGSRVWAVLVREDSRHPFVEQVYLPERAQAEQALAIVKERARARHPFYGDTGNAEVFARQAAPDFVQEWRLVRVRRVTALRPAAGAVDAPVQSAANVLEGLLKVRVHACGIYDKRRQRFLVYLPTQAMVDQAETARLDAVSGQVEADLKAPDSLLEKPRFVEDVETRKDDQAPMDRVLTVQQAADYLGRGDVRDAEHEVQASEKARAIAERYGAKVEDLAAWNPGVDLTRLRVGDKLRVRRPEALLTVLTVEQRSFVQGGQRITIEIRRHNGVEANRIEKDRRPAP